MKLLEGKVAIVTGGSRGIGKAIAMKMAQEGANIAFTYRTENDSMRETLAELEATGVKVKGYSSDASSFDGTDKVVTDILEEFGQIDILVNNAGITRDTLLMRMTEEDWDTVMVNNLKSAFNFTKAVQKTMLKQRKGSIVNISSVVGVNGNAGQSNYAASKAGMIGFTKSIAQELGSRNIRCNVVTPGFIETDMTLGKLSEEIIEKWMQGIPLKRGGKSEEVANVVAFLASDQASYVTGQTLNVCGGMST